MHSRATAPQSLPLIHAHILITVKICHFGAVCMYYWQTLRGCSSAVHEPYATKLLQKFYILVDHPAQSLIFHYVHVYKHNTCTSTPYCCMHIVCMHMHEVTGSFGRIVVHEHTEAYEKFYYLESKHS